MKTLRPLQNQSGVAMLMAMVTMLILAVLAGELVYNSQVYSGLVFRQRDQLRATLLARSALKLGMLQLRAAKKAKAKAKSLGLGDNSTLTDRIWQTPLVLPPPIPPDLDPNSRIPLEEFSKSLGLEGTLTTTIAGENDRTPINQLVWLKANASPTPGSGGTPGTGSGTGTGGTPGTPAFSGGDQAGLTGVTPEAQKQMLEQSRKDFAQLLQDLLDKKRQSDDAFREKYPTITGETLMGNLLAWMDPQTRLDGENQDKNTAYSRIQPTPYSPKEAPMVSLSELFMVKGFEDPIARLIGDNFTTQQPSSLDVNKASPLLLHAFIPELTPDALDKVVKRRTDDTQGGPFKTDKDFWAYLNTLGNYADAQKRLTDKGITILGDETAYRIIVTTQSGMARKTWVAEVGSLPPAPSGPQPPGTVVPATPTAAPPAQPGSPNPSADPGATGPQTGNDNDSLNIVYLKTE
jgi:type II secretory pathway component PulK